MVKRYLVFAIYGELSNGGVDDAVKAFNTLNESDEYARSLFEDEEAQDLLVQVFDKEEGTVNNYRLVGADIQVTQSEIFRFGEF